MSPEEKRKLCDAGMHDLMQIAAVSIELRYGNENVINWCRACGTLQYSEIRYGSTHDTGERKPEILYPEGGAVE